MNKKGDLKTQFTDIYNSADKHYYLFDKHTGDGMIMLFIEDKYYIININFESIELENVGVDFAKKNGLTSVALSDSLENEDLDSIKGYNSEKKEEVLYTPLSSVYIKDSLGLIYILEDEVNKKLKVLAAENLKSKEYLITMSNYNLLRSILDPIHKWRNKVKKATNKIRREYYIEDNKVSDITCLFWVNEILSRNNCIGVLKTHMLTELIKETIYYKNHLVNMETLIDKTVELHSRDIINDEVFIRLFTTSNSRIKFILKYSGVDAVKELDFDDGDSFNLKNFSYNEKIKLFNKDYSFKEELLLKIIEKGQMINYIEKEEQYGLSLLSYSYLSELNYFLDKNFENNKCSVFLEEIIKISKIYNLSFGITDKKIYGSNGPITYNLDYILYIDANHPKRRGMYDTIDYNIKSCDINLNGLEKIELLNEEEKYVLKLLNVLNILDLKDEERIKIAFDQAVKESIKYNSLE